MRFLKRLFLICALFIFGASVPDVVHNASAALTRLQDGWVLSSRSVSVRPLSSDVTEAGQHTAERAMPGVVTVYGITEIETHSASEGLRRMFTSRVKVSSGSGFLVDSDGYIVTNRHVVDEEDARYMVMLENGDRVRAEVIYRDPEQDLALVKIPGENFPALPLADNTYLSRGQNVVSIGNAFGDFPQSISQGTVTAARRNLVPINEDVERLRGVIETTAVLYPGYSGGPMLDSDGNVVAVNVAAAIDESFSYGIPVERVKEMVETVSLIEKGLGYTEQGR